jgi:ribosomal protein S27E
MTDHSSGDASSSAGQQQFDEILAELMRAIDAGELVHAEDWITRYPDFTTQLRDFFAKNERVEKLVRPLRQAAAKALHVRCPHCHNKIELLDQAPLSDISCPSCGSSFSLIGDNTLSHDLNTKSFGHFELLDRVGIGQFTTGHREVHIMPNDSACREQFLQSDQRTPDRVECAC